MDPRLQGLLAGYAALALLDLACYPLFGVRIDRRIVASHLAIWLFLFPMLAFVGIVYPFVLILLCVLLPIELLLRPTPQLAARGKHYLAFAVACVAFLVAGISAPLRALGVGLQMQWAPFPIDLVLVEGFGLGPRPVALFDVFTAACGVLLGAVGGTLAVLRLSSQARQIEALPTTRARAAAVGLVEIAGIARAAEPDAPVRVEESGDSSAWAGLEATWSEALLFHGSATIADPDRGSRGARSATRRKRACFYVDDGTGRIRVDPRAADFWDGSGGVFFAPALALHLQARTEKIASGCRSVAVLRPGDPVYLFGSAEIDPHAAPHATDVERLVVRPRPRPRKSWVERIGLLEATPLVADEHAFFLSGSSEQSAAAALRSATRTSVVFALGFVLSSLWLISARTEGFTGVPSEWRSTASIERRARRARNDYEARLARIGPDSKAPLPELDELLRSPEPAARRRGVSILDKLATAEVVKIDAAIPALVETVTAARDLHWTEVNEVVSAAALLGKLGPRASGAVPVLLRNLEHEEPLVRVCAVRALARIAPGDPTTTAAIAPLLEDPVPGVQNEARRALAALGSALGSSLGPRLPDAADP